MPALHSDRLYVSGGVRRVHCVNYTHCRRWFAPTTAPVLRAYPNGGRQVRLPDKWRRIQHATVVALACSRDCFDAWIAAQKEK